MIKLFNRVPIGTEVRHRLTGDVGIVVRSGFSFKLGALSVTAAHVVDDRQQCLGQWVEGKRVVQSEWLAALVEPTQARAGILLGEIR